MKIKEIALMILVGITFSETVSAEVKSYSSELLLQANQGDAKAQYNLGVMYYVDGLDRSSTYFELAYEWFQKAALQNYPDALSGLARMYYSGQYVEKDELKAIEYYKRAAQLGHIQSQFILGCILIEGEDRIPPNPEQSIYWLTQAANAGLNDAQLALGVLYYEGISVEKDFIKARSYLQLATSLYGTNGSTILGEIYRDGLGVKQDYHQAMKYFLAEDSSYGDQVYYNIAQLYENGQGVAKNYSKAAEYYLKAAESGREEARQRLANLYRQGGFGL